jgi:hypothetical protein
MQADAARFAGSMLVGAALLFCVEPMVAKMIMPMLGGAPAVWITCMVFFQAALLAGYAYSHATTAWLGARKQALLHLAVIGLPLLVLPIRIGIHAEHGAVDPNHPITFLLWTLVVGVGLPFFVLSTTAPLLQKWFSVVASNEKDPYFLYGASNLGSLVALIAYPAIIELHLGLFDQSTAWRWGYCIFAALVALCALTVLRTKTIADDREVAATEMPAPSSSSISLQRRLKWIFLSFVPSSFLLGVTNYITTDVAPVPLFWVIPLALYLATFVLVFAKKPPLPHRWMVRVLPLGITATTLIYLTDGSTPMTFITGLHLVTFFLASMVCHGALANDRPPPEKLTEFYLWVSVGGVLGGIFNGIVAPAIFSTLVEYPLAMVLACLCRTVDDERNDARAKQLDIAIPIALGLLMVALLFVGRAIHTDRAGAAFKLIVAVPVFINYSFLKRPRRFAFGVGACLIGGSSFGGILGTTVHVERNFFGVVRVTHDDAGKYVQIAHGTTIHGAQSRDPARRRDPLVYYSRTGPLGQVFDAFRAKGSSPKEVGVIGLGAGTMAPYRQPNETWTYYEIDPAVISIAENPAYFTYLTDAFPDRDHLHVVLGDARLRMHDAADRRYDLIVVDAFSSDSIPAHLLTREAIALYRSKLADDGFIVVHISNRYLDLEPVFGNLAKDAGMVARIRNDFDVPQAELDAGKTMSQWLVLASDVAHLGTIQTDARWVDARTSAKPVWTDDFSNLLSVYRW